MRKVRIISGAYGHRNGNRIDTKDRRSEPFSLDDAEAARLVSIGVAEIVGEDVATPKIDEETVNTGENTPEDEESAEDAENALDDECDTGETPYTERPEYSIETSATDLRKIAKEVGITFKVGTTKEDMVDELDEYFDSIPDLTAESPVE